MAVAVVIGASGAVGRFLVARLLERGDDVIAISRKARVSSHARLRWLVGDLHAGLPRLPACDVLYSLGPLDAFALWFEETPWPAPVRVIACSSMSAESKQGSSDEAERATAERLQQAEAVLAAAAAVRGCAWTVFRPTLVYGAGVDRSLSPIARFARRWRVFPLIRGARGLRQPVHADDLAAACIAISVHAETISKIYPLGGAERVAFSTMLARIRASLRVATLPVPIPLVAVRALRGIAKAAGAQASSAAVERLQVDLIAEHASAIADFGWAPRGFHPVVDAWTPVSW
ncbi:MAG: NAD-dependent epimerase/dehydratase family protein [Dokdonella sp.]|uniref:SDR family oxidoreductase n=1 Tax=Dokdonella sp. TaxID=2291710 RepID=UPI0032676EE8